MSLYRIRTESVVGGGTAPGRTVSGAVVTRVCRGTDPGTVRGDRASSGAAVRVRASTTTTEKGGSTGRPADVVGPMQEVVVRTRDPESETRLKTTKEYGVDMIKDLLEPCPSGE